MTSRIDKAIEQTLTRVQRLAYDDNYEQAINQVVDILEYQHKEIKILQEALYNKNN